VIAEDQEQWRLRVFSEEVNIIKDFEVVNRKKGYTKKEKNFEQDYQLMIRPENVEIAEEDLPATIVWIEPLGSIIRYLVEVESREVTILKINRDDKGLNVGETIFIQFHWEKASLIRN